MKRTIRTIPLLALAALVLATVACGGEPATVPESDIFITYEVGGTTDKASLTYENKDGNSEQKTVSVPWRFSFEAKPGAFLYVSAQNERESGSVTCKILENNLVKGKAASEGAFVIAKCSRTAGED